MKTSFTAAWALSVFLAGAFYPASAQTPVWSPFPNAPSGTTPRFDDLSFVNETTGWVARATGGIYKTTDGGNTFTLSRSSAGPYPGTNLTAHFRSIAFVSDTHGFAGNLGPGSYDATVTDTNILFETLNGGTNWAVKPGFPETGMKGLCAIQALDAQHLYGGGRVRGPAYFVKSTDGGTNWSITNLTAAGVLGGIMDVYFKDQTNGFLVGMDTNAFNTSCVPPFYHGAIARTTNGGASWQVVASSGVNCAYFWKMAWPSPNIGYASLQQNSMTPGDNHIVYKTTDGGATWASNGVPFSVIGVSTFYSQGIGFVTTNEGWVGGDSSTSPYANNFLHTTDGGASWTPVGTADTLRVNRIRFLRPDYAVASGARVLAYRVPLEITTQPGNLSLNVGSNATFNVTAQGSTTLAYQWRFNGTNIAGANTNVYTIAAAQTTNVGNYDVIVGDISGSLTSAVATLTFPFADDFDGYGTPVTVTSLGTTNGYKIFFNAAAGPLDFKAIFGFDYSAVTFPTNILPAPHSVGGTTKGLYLTVNKDTSGQVAAVNLYPVTQWSGANFALKFDLWLNWGVLGFSTEHAMFGINHSGNVTNRIGLATSDGLFFAADGDGGVAATATALRDYSVLRGGGAAAIPILMLNNNTVFGPTSPLGPQFDNSDPGFLSLFPSKTFATLTTPAGSAGLGWVTVEVRQVNRLITCLFNGAAIAQYTNTSGYTNGTIMIGYSDNFSSLGDTNNFAIFDNLRVETIALAPVLLQSPQVSGNNFSFSFATEPYESYTVQWTTNLAASTWQNLTNLVGNGGPNSVVVPLLNAEPQFFRVSRP